MGRRIGTLVDAGTVDAYQDERAQLNKIISTQYDRSRRLGVIKDRLKDNDAAAIRKLGMEQDRLKNAIESYAARLATFVDDEAKIGKELNQSRAFCAD